MALEPEVLESEDFKKAVADAVAAEVKGLKENRDLALEQKRKAREQLEAYGELTPDEARELAKAKKKAEEEAAKKAGDFDKLKAQLEEAHTKQMKQVAAERDELQTALEHELIEKAAIEGITEAGGFAKVLKPHVIGKMRLHKTDDGKRLAVVLDESGQPALKKGASNPTDFMSVKDFVASLKDDDEFSHAFKGAGASGGATTPRVEHGGDKNARTKQAAQGVTFI